jgi:hypothetical protein
MKKIQFFLIVLSAIAATIFNTSENIFSQQSIALAQPENQKRCEETIGCPRGDKPSIVSPRNGLILDHHHFVILWHAVDGATHYTLEIPELNILERLETTSFTHPTEQLKPDERYAIRVIAHVIQGDQSLQFEDRILFGIISPEQQTQVQRQIEAITQQNLDSKATVLATAQVYQSALLYNDAINILTQYVKNVGVDVQIYHKLAELYDVIRLPETAVYYTELANTLEPISQ